MNEKDKILPINEAPKSLFGSINQCVPFLNHFIEFAKSKFDDEEIKVKLDDIVGDFWQHELFE